MGYYLLLLRSLNVADFTFSFFLISGHALAEDFAGLLVRWVRRDIRWLLSRLRHHTAMIGENSPVGLH